jgi:hypothetical protein
MVLNLMIGLLTPPVGMVLYVLARIAKIPFEQAMMATLPFLIPLVVTLMLITFIPGDDHVAADPALPLSPPVAPARRPRHCGPAVQFPKATPWLCDSRRGSLDFTRTGRPSRISKQRSRVSTSSRCMASCV